MKFGHFQDTGTVNVLKLLPAGIILGIIGGVLGALFIHVNTVVNDVRKKLLKSKWIKPLETFFFCFATASAFYSLSYRLGKCVELDEA